MVYDNVNVHSAQLFNICDYTEDGCWSQVNSLKETNLVYGRNPVRLVLN